MTIEYNSKYDEQIKDLLIELQEHLVKIDKEKYHIMGKEYRELYFQKMMEEIRENNGKIYLYEEQKHIIGFVAGIINNEEESTYDFKPPKRGRITELIVSKEYRGKHIGKDLLEKMKQYLKQEGCQKVMIAVFGYNENAIRFYENNGFHVRMIDMIDDE